MTVGSLPNDGIVVYERPKRKGATVLGQSSGAKRRARSTIWPDEVQIGAKGLFRSTRELRGYGRMEVRSRRGFGCYVECRGLMAHGDNLSVATARLIRLLDPDVELLSSADRRLA